MLRQVLSSVLETLGQKSKAGTSSKFLTIFEDFLAGRDLDRFFFVQVGANNGIANDSLYGLVTGLRLRGLLIEPQPAAFAALKDNYKDHPDLLFENVAIAAEEGARNLYTIRKDLAFLEYANQAASFDYSHIQRQLRNHLARGASRSVVKTIRDRKLTVEDCIEAQTVRTATFQSLLDTHRVVHFDLLQIDTEGFDYEVIKMANIRHHLPSIIHYEHEHLSDHDQAECREMLESCGYLLQSDEGDTTAYLNWKKTLAL